MDILNTKDYTAKELYEQGNSIEDIKSSLYDRLAEEVYEREVNEEETQKIDVTIKVPARVVEQLIEVARFYSMDVSVVNEVLTNAVTTHSTNTLIRWGSNALEFPSKPNYKQIAEG